jgi:hypothetical protein
MKRIQRLMEENSTLKQDLYHSLEYNKQKKAFLSFLEAENSFLHSCKTLNDCTLKFPTSQKERIIGELKYQLGNFQENG